jgi:hypothetical protein
MKLYGYCEDAEEDEETPLAEEERKATRRAKARELDSIMYSVPSKSLLRRTACSNARFSAILMTGAGLELVHWPHEPHTQDFSPRIHTDNVGRIIGLMST